MSNQSPIIYLSLGEDGNISIATKTPAKYVPTITNEAIPEGKVAFSSQWVDLPPVTSDDIGFCLASDEQMAAIWEGVRAATVDRAKE